MKRMIRAAWIGVAFLVLMLGIIDIAHAVCTGGPQTYTCLEDNDYLSKLTEFGYGRFSEGFEDDAAWGEVRIPNGAPSVTSQNIIWTPNHLLPNTITTGLGGAYTGNYGVFDIVHGSATGSEILCDIDNPRERCLCHDGFIGTRTVGAGLLYGVGGYVRGQPAGANIEFRVGSLRLELGQLPDASHHFFGVIDTRGFREFEVRDIEGKIGEKFSIFGDDFTFGVTDAGGNSTPVADAGPDQTAFVGDTVTLDDSGSSDVDGDALTHKWSLPLPAGSAALMPTFVADSAGDYVVKLIVNDRTA